MFFFNGKQRLFVLPTPVGMVRCSAYRRRGEERSPHARGDGPPCKSLRWGCALFSPRPWGWSGALRPSCIYPRGSPHARGDGPSATPFRRRSLRFSPRPWGWSGLRQTPHRYRAVLPTPVGMVRTASSADHAAPRSPHARGDGPAATSGLVYLGTFSPRPWGWSDHRCRGCDVREVLPTPVGMVRFAPSGYLRRRRSPHARGDGPNFLRRRRDHCWFSPRPWGWSELPDGSVAVDTVLPTPVGMVRPGRVDELKLGCSPHARGDGPGWSCGSSETFMFSPRPWGWSVHKCR